MSAEPMTEREYQRLYFEVYHLPAQIERARAKLAMLEERARKHRLYALLRDPAKASDMLEMEAVRAFAENRECDPPCALRKDER